MIQSVPHRPSRKASSAFCGPGTSCTKEPSLSCRVDADCRPDSVTDLGPCLLKQNSGVGFNFRAAYNLVRGNSFGGTGTMERGVSFGGIAANATIDPFFPGTCSGDSTRRCLDQTDCNIEGYDPSPGVGSCMGAAPITFNDNTTGLVAEDNLLTGAYQTAALFSNNTDGFIFRGNIVEGGAAVVSGIRTGGMAINGTIERNVLRAAPMAFSCRSRPRAG